jgi:hypothetical protein
MSDIRYDVFQHYGTEAERLAFTPDPASGIQPLYLWFETDTGKTWIYHTAWSQITGGGTTVLPFSYLVQGGQVVWITGYDFTVSAAEYYIDGIHYTSPETDLTLDTPDVSNPRIDVFAVNTSGAVVKITGTASATPSKPSVDPGTQLEVGWILVPASSTDPGTTNEVIYYDNAGDPSEYNWTTSGSGFNVNSTNSPKSPSAKDIEGTAVAANAYAQGEKGTGTFDPNTAKLLILYIQSKATWSTGRTLSITLRLSGVQVGSPVVIQRSGSYGFNSATTGVYQLVAIPITAFAIPAGSEINQIRITAGQSGHGFYIDDVYFQKDGATISGDFITLEQADARYLLKSNNLTDLTNTTTATAQLNSMVGDSGSGGTKGLVPAPASGDAAAGKYLKADGVWTAPSFSVADDSITNAKLSEVAEATIKGRISSGTGNPEDLTGTQATTLLSNVVGDAGAGGTKGLVPAPGAGDAAASKFLKANGSWETVPASGDVTGPVSSTDGHVVLFNGTTGKVIKSANAALATVATSGAYGDLSGRYKTVGITIDGGGTVITTGTKGAIQVPFAGTIIGWSIIADLSGSISVEVDKAASSAPPSAPAVPNTTTDKISASAPVVLSGAQSAASGTTGVSTWTTAVAQFDVIQFYVASASTVTRTTLYLRIQE